MKHASDELIQYLQSEQSFLMADLYEFLLIDGTALRYSSFDADFLCDDRLYSATGPIIRRSRTRCVIGVEVDTLNLEVVPGSNDLLLGAPWLQSAGVGALDGATLALYRVFLQPDLSVVGGITLFVGQVSGKDGKVINNSEPRANGVTFQGSIYGAAIPIVYGRARVSGNLLWYGDFKAIAHTTSQDVGGKGGGGTTVVSTTYSYRASFIFGLCEGPITGIDGIWSNRDYKPDPANLSEVITPSAAWNESHLVSGSHQVTVAHGTQWTSHISCVNVETSATLTNGTDFTVVAGTYYFATQYATRCGQGGGTKHPPTIAVRLQQLQLQTWLETLPPGANRPRHPHRSGRRTGPNPRPHSCHRGG